MPLTKHLRAALTCESSIGHWSHSAPRKSKQRRLPPFSTVKKARVDGLIAKIRQAIDHLKEFRTALISAAVTGKIDVREEAS